MISSVAKSSVLQGLNKSRSMLVGNTGSSPWYFATLNKGATFEGSQAIYVDNSNNIFIGQGVDGNNNGALTKLSVNPLTITQNKWVSATQQTTVQDVETDSSGNIYMAILDDIANPRRGYLMKTNSTMSSITWQKGLYYNVTNSASQFNAVAVDSSGNVFGVGSFFKPTLAYFASVAKYNSSGTLQWQREIRGASGQDTYGYDCVLDSSGNLYVVGSSIPTAGQSSDGFLIKYNTSGTLQWQRKLTTTSQATIFRKITIDSSSSNLYITGESYSNAITVVYNTSGTIQWQRKIGNGSYHYGRGIGLDSSNNVYITGYGDFGDGVNMGLLCKYNSTGTLQWQRRIKIGTTVNIYYNLKMDSNNYINGTGTTAISGDYYSTFYKLPNDGAATGTYSINGATITYAASTLTEAVGGMTDAAGTNTDAAGTQTEITGSLSWSDLTETLTTTGVI